VCIYRLSTHHRYVYVCVYTACQHIKRDKGTSKERIERSIGSSRSWTINTIGRAETYTCRESLALLCLINTLQWGEINWWTWSAAGRRLPRLRPSPSERSLPNNQMGKAEWVESDERSISFLFTQAETREFIYNREQQQQAPVHQRVDVSSVWELVAHKGGGGRINNLTRPALIGFWKTVQSTALDASICGSFVQQPRSIQR
jgi:hypothetical protein